MVTKRVKTVPVYCRRSLNGAVREKYNAPLVRRQGLRKCGKTFWEVFEGFILSIEDLVAILCKANVGNYGHWTQCSNPFERGD